MLRFYVFAWCLLNAQQLIANHQFDYELRTRFLYTDEISTNSTTLVLGKELQSTNSSVGGYRNLGLAFLAVDTKFTSKSTSFTMRLRPDAQIGRTSDTGTISQEIDTRSGSVYWSAPLVRTLDLYKLSFIDTPSFQFYYGVKNYSYQDNRAYRSPLAFGLEVWFPRKFSSLGISWKSSNEISRSLEQPYPSKFQYSLFTLETSEDRAESVSQSESAADYGLVSTDPHTGLASEFTYRPESSIILQSFIGYLDEKVEGGLKSRLLLALNSFVRSELWSHPVLFSFGARYSHERWNVTENTYPELFQISSQLGVKLFLKPRHAVYLGFNHGTVQQPISSNQLEKSIHSGNQIDFGYRTTIYELTSLDIAFSSEYRTIEEAGVTRGGFTIRDEPERNLQRIALEINYQII